MKLKLFFCLVSLCSLFLMNAITANSSTLLARMEIIFSATDTPFTKPKGREKEPRSLPIAIPFSAFLDDDKSINIDFYQEIGEIEIIISHNGSVIYSSSENIASPVVKNIQLPQDLSGSFLLEVKNDDGAYTFGHFDL